MYRTQKNLNKPCSVPALNGRDRFVSGEEDEYEEKYISLSGEKILSWVIDGDVYHIHYGISILEGGSGRATITSPAIMTVRGGKGYVQIEWSSPNYDYMKVENKTFKPLQETGNSTFELPIIDFDMPIAVVANTTAMSTPHEIEYTLTFLQDTIKQDTSFEMMAMVAGTVIVIAIVVIISFFGIHKKRRSK